MSKAGLNRLCMITAGTYTEWDTEIYPKGLKDGLLEVKKKYNLPVYITENGIRNV